MPPPKRRAIWAIYVWCRRTDELMDSEEAQARTPSELEARLDAWETRTRAIFDGRVSDGLDQVMVDTLERYPQDLQPYLDMIEGQRMDLSQTRYQSFEDLKLYCYRVAGTVGLMTREVMGLDPAYTSAPWSVPPDTSESAIALGIANQLTNILRDVGEDRGRGRIYLPQEDLVRFGYSEEDLLGGVLDDNWRRLMRFQVARAREWFARSEAGVRWLAPDARWPVWTSLRLYRGILDVIEQLNYDVFNHRAFLPRTDKLLDLPRSFVISQAR
jgi:phytoene synthase